MANGLILAFELSRVEYGVIALMFGVVVSVAGFVATETDRNTAISWLFFILCLFFLSEASYFSTFGTGITVFGFSLLPRQVFVLPTAAFLLLIALVIIVQIVRSLRHRSK